MPTADDATSLDLHALPIAAADPEETREEARLRARQQAAVLAFGRRTNAQPRLAVLMQDAVSLVAEILDADFSSVARVAANGAALRIEVVAAGEQQLSDGPAVCELPPDAEESMAAYALNSGSPVVTSDLASEKRFRDRFLLKLGLVGAATVPLHIGQKPFGTLGIYTAEKREFTPDDVAFAETITHLLSSSVARIKVEEELRRQRALLSTLMETVNALVLVVDSGGNLISTNPGCLRVAQFSEDEVRGKPFWSVFIGPDEMEFVRSLFRGLKKDGRPREFDSSLLTKDGTRRHISWSSKVMRDEKDQIESVVLTGIDQTELVSTARELDNVKDSASRATKALEELHDRAMAEELQDRTPAVPAHPTADAWETAKDHDQPSPPFELLDEKRGRTLRKSPRRVYEYRQIIAPVLGDAMPLADDFFPVECRDISAGGIAFYLNRQPEFKALVVGLGRPPKVTYFTAEVIHFEKVEHRGQERYLLGCHFTGRVNM